MVGRVWSDFEERYFWRTAVAYSSKRAGIDRANHEKTWDQLAIDMYRFMERHNHVRRQYTSTMLFEHYFQNIEGERRSPNAAMYVNEYLRKLGPNRQVSNPMAPRPRRERRYRVRSGRWSQSPVGSTADERYDREDDTPSDDASLPSIREMNLPDPRSLRSPHPGLSEHRRYRETSARSPPQPLRRLRPLLPTSLATPATSMLSHSPLATSYDSSLYSNELDVSGGWDIASPPFASSYGTPIYHQTHQLRTPLTSAPSPNNFNAVAWGFELGRRSAILNPPSSILPMPQTSPTATTAQNQYSQNLDLEALLNETGPLSSDTFSQVATLGRDSSLTSFDSGLHARNENSSNYQFRDVASPNAMSSTYSSFQSLSPGLPQAPSNQSEESGLFVEDNENENGNENDGSYIDYIDDGNVEGSEEGEIRQDTDVHFMTYREFRD
ncbi:hypothetical protein F5B19DRAFT_497274 [Rostrohypoxylon terebratum]|nr:hypothetical protein F5B19DRAFT_497274 [Rostrohypoxylon terebratum]